MKLRSKNSVRIAAALLLCLGLCLAYHAVRFAAETAMPQTTDAQDYAKTLARSGYPNDPGSAFFPAEIPDTAAQVQFSYSATMGGTVFALKYALESGDLDVQEARFSATASWSGAPADPAAKERGIYPDSLRVLDYDTARPADLRLYVVHSQPYRRNDWNHGEVGLVAISREQGEILFFSSVW